MEKGEGEVEIRDKEVGENGEKGRNILATWKKHRKSSKIKVFQLSAL